MNMPCSGRSRITLCGFQICWVLRAGDDGDQPDDYRWGLPGYVGLITWIIFPIADLGRLILQMSTGMVSYERVMKMIKEVREPLDEGDVRPDGNLAGISSFNRWGSNMKPAVLCWKISPFTAKPGQGDCPAGFDRFGQDHPGEPAAALL